MFVCSGSVRPVDPNDLLDLYKYKSRIECIPTSKSKAAGFSDSRELSSFSGVRHFWQYMLVMG